MPDLIRNRNPRLRIALSLALGLGIAAITAPAEAQDLVYQPINPSFGGNPFNSSHLLGVANAINDKEPDTEGAATDGAGNNINDTFVRQLQSRLLSELSRDITDSIFGENAVESGEVVFGSQRISFFRTLTDVNLTIVDTETGSVSEFSVPLLQIE
ncbi:MAG: hypothetical protein GVY13_09645 [Alphaproteobacteria bacterium]|nr:hypothetical protein [Alphaproteobacteria bacterium]